MKIIITVDLAAEVPDDFVDLDAITLDMDPSLIEIEGADGVVQNSRVIGYCTQDVYAN